MPVAYIIKANETTLFAPNLSAINPKIVAKVPHTIACIPIDNPKLVDVILRSLSKN